MKGAFQTSREIFENPIWNDIPKFRLFFFIVGNAVFSHEGVKKGGIHIKRGQFLRSYRNLRDDLEYIDNRSVKKYSISVIKRKIDSLVSEERLEIQESELGTLFTVVNYDKYQGFENYKKDNLERSENAHGTQMERTWNNNKNVKKEKNVNNEKKKNSPKQAYDEDSIFFQLANRLYQKILTNDEGFKKPNLQTWANDVRLMMERDKRTEEQIIYLIEWSQSHHFWKSNILSVKSLRKQYTKLTIQVKEEKAKKSNPHTRFGQPKVEQVPKWLDGQTSDQVEADSNELEKAKREAAKYRELLKNKKKQRFG